MKKMMIKNLVYAGFLSLFFISCRVHDTKQFDAKEEQKIVAKVIHNCIGWAKNKDIALAFSVIANDSGLLIVNPDVSVSFGFNEFKKNEDFWMSPYFKAIKYDIRDLVIQFSKSGDVAWYYCILDDINEWKGQPASWENTRWTGVLEKREGKWVIVQMHFSFAQK